MPISPKLRIAALVLIVVFALALLHIGAPGHGVCSDCQCVACKLLRTLLELLPLALLRLCAALLAPLRAIRERLTTLLLPLYGTTLVKQKIKLTI